MVGWFGLEICRYLGVHVDGRVAGVSGCYFVGEGEHLLGEGDVSGGDGRFCPLFFCVLHCRRDGWTGPVSGPVGRCNPADAATPIFFSVWFWAAQRRGS